MGPRRKRLQALLTTPWLNKQGLNSPPKPQPARQKPAHAQRTKDTQSHPPEPRALGTQTTCKNQHHDHKVWILTDEDALPEGSNLSGNKSLMDKYPEDEANSKKTKKTNTGKGKQGNPKNKK